MFSEISKCRIFHNSNLITELSLGNQSLTEIFPRHPQDDVSSSPLERILCAITEGKWYVTRYSKTVPDF